MTGEQKGVVHGAFYMRDTRPGKLPFIWEMGPKDQKENRVSNYEETILLNPEQEPCSN